MRLVADQDLDIVYVKGKKNMVADVLSCTPPRGPLVEESVELDKLGAIEAATLDKGFIKKFKKLSQEDPNYSRLIEEPDK